VATRSTNTYSEGLQALIQDIASLQLAPDANVGFLQSLQQAIIEETQAPLRAQAAQAAATPGGAVPQPAAPPGAVPAGGMPGAPPGPPPGGLAALLGMGGPENGSSPLPRTDTQSELDRMLR